MLLGLRSLGTSYDEVGHAIQGVISLDTSTILAEKNVCSTCRIHLCSLTEHQLAAAAAVLSSNGGMRK